jgi:RNA 3'-terminal phosphate cyclase (ATP)
MITLDGSQGEGGGQILRSALALSLVTGQPFRIHQIRARRPKPGLMRQHLACVEAAARIGNATTEGAALGSRELVFQPGTVTPGNHTFKIEGAGSTMLLLQTVLMPLLLADAPSELTLEGGTHNPFAPPFPFVEAAFLPLLWRIGFRVEAVLDHPGFYPRGGGRCLVRIESSISDTDPASRQKAQKAQGQKPWDDSCSDGISCGDSATEDTSFVPCAHFCGHSISGSGVKRLELPARSEKPALSAVICLAGLPKAVADRESDVLQQRLGLHTDQIQVRTESDAFGPGNTVHVMAGLDGYSEVFTGFGAPKKRAEVVAEEAASEAEAFLGSQAAVGPHLADQLLLPMALAKGGSFVTMEPSSHTRTNIEVIRQFLEVKTVIESAGANLWHLSIK